MNNIFIEIKIIKDLIEKNSCVLENLLIYSYEILAMSNANSIENKNIDTFLDYMPYYKYASLISNNFKLICRTLKQEINQYKVKIQILRKQLRANLLKVYRLSKISKEELTFFLSYFAIPFSETNFDSIYLLDIFNDDIQINPTLNDYFGIDAISCLFEYINQKYYDESLTLIDYLNCLKLDEINVLN